MLSILGLVGGKEVGGWWKVEGSRLKSGEWKTRELEVWNVGRLVGWVFC